MKKWLLSAAVLTLMACSSTNSGKIYYQLPVRAQAVGQTVSQSGGKVLWVDQIALADFLGQNGLVYQTSDVQYTIASNNLWASPLDQQLRTALINDLSAALPGWVVASQPLGQDPRTLSLNVTGFHGRYDGRVIVSGEWLLQHNGDIIRRPFNLVLPQQKDGYDAMVKTLAEGWQKEANQIASELQSAS